MARSRADGHAVFVAARGDEGHARQNFRHTRLRLEAKQVIITECGCRILASHVYVCPEQTVAEEFGTLLMLTRTLSSTVYSIF